MSKMNDPDYVRPTLHNFGTKTISTESGIEYCVEFTTEDKQQTRLLWFKQAGEYVRLNAEPEITEEAYV